VSGGYTQEDVVNVARAFTGWSITPFPGTAPLQRSTTFTFNERRHDSGEKVVLGRTLRSHRGMQDAEEVLDLLARHPATARFISTKLARRLVSDNPPRALVDRATETFTRTDGNITEVVRTILSGPEFFSRAAFRAKARTPFEYVVSIRRALNAPPDTSMATRRVLSQFGQPMFGRITPDGWPDDQAEWINAGAIMKRVLFAGDVANSRLRHVRPEMWDGWARYSLAPGHQQVDAIVQLFFGGITNSATREVLRQAEQRPLRPNEFRDAPRRMREMMAVAIGSPEFQKR
jgi:uncharacterized protein (DUF1800 family)